MISWEGIRRTSKTIEKQGEKQRKVIQVSGEKQLIVFNEDIRQNDDDNNADDNGFPFHGSNGDSEKFFRQKKYLKNFIAK